MKKRSRLSLELLSRRPLLLATVAALSSCGGEQSPPPGQRVEPVIGDTAGLGADPDTQPAGEESTVDPVVARFIAGLGGDTILTRWGACPFECCVYRSWHSGSDIPLRPRPDMAAAVHDTLPTGTTFDADTGFVRITSPQLVVVEDSVEAYLLDPGERYEGRNVHLVPGDTLLVLEYVGEGHYRLARGEDRLSAQQFWPLPDGSPPWQGTRGNTIGDYAAQWWVHARLPDGRDGWFRADSDIRLSNVDACA